MFIVVTYIGKTTAHCSSLYIQQMALFPLLNEATVLRYTNLMSDSPTSETPIILGFILAQSFHTNVRLLI
jgi:hypothetical protein